MCKMKDEAMFRTGELHSPCYYDVDRNKAVIVGHEGVGVAALVKPEYDATAVMAVTRQMIDLAREIDGAGSTLMVSQAAAVLDALRALPVVDSRVHTDLTKVMRGEIATLTAECERLAEVRNAAGSVDRNAKNRREPSVERVAGTITGWNDALIEVRATVEEMNLEAFGEHSQNMAKCIVDGVLDAIDDMMATPVVPVAQPLAPSGAVPQRTDSCNLIDYSRHIAQQQAMGLQPMGLSEFARAVTDAAAQPIAPSGAVELIPRLREYAAEPGYSHGDYADTMRQAADALAAQPLAGQDVRAVTEYVLDGYYRKNGKHFDRLKSRPNYHTLESGWVAHYVAAPSPVNPKQEQA